MQAAMSSTMPLIASTCRKRSSASETLSETLADAETVGAGWGCRLMECSLRLAARPIIACHDRTMRALTPAGIKHVACYAGTRAVGPAFPRDSFQSYPDADVRLKSNPQESEAGGQ